MSIRVSVNISGFLQWAEKEPERATQMMRLFQYHGSQIVVGEMRQQAPKKTGFLVTTIGADFTPEGFMVYPGASYASIVERGARPHEILPRFVKALAFEWKGAMRFFQRVQHPGFPGRKFIERTREIVKPKLFDLMRRIWRELHER